MDSEVDDATLAAYRRAEYRTLAGWSLRIDQPSPMLAIWQREHGVRCSAFVSAVNPRSRLLTDWQNRQRHQALRALVAAEGLVFVEGAGADPDSRWPDEPAFLIGGLKRDSAAALGRRFNQNAVVWAGEDATPRLILLR